MSKVNIGVDYKRLKDSEIIEDFLNEKVMEISKDDEFFQKNSKTDVSKFNCSYNENWLYKDQYLKLCNILKVPPLKEQDFRDTFPIDYFGINVEEFFLKNNDKFDLIIASKILSHINKDTKIIIKQLHEKLNDKGVLFFRFNSDGYTVGNEIKKVYSIEDVREYTQYFSRTIELYYERKSQMTNIVLIAEK